MRDQVVEHWQMRAVPLGGRARPVQLDTGGGMRQSARSVVVAARLRSARERQAQDAPACGASVHRAAH